MKPFLFSGAAAVALASLPVPAMGQHHDMTGMAMPMPTPSRPAAKKPAKKTAVKKSAARQKTATKKTPPKSPSAAGVTAPKSESQHATMPGMTMPVDTSAMDHGEMPSVPAETTMPNMDSSQMPIAEGETVQGAMSSMEHGGHVTMTGAYGPYPMTRESSGTSWQPDSSEDVGVMSQSGGWMLMAHGVLNMVFDDQSGPRGDDKAFAAGMLMGMAQRPLGDGIVQFKAMISPDPLMGKSGYPLLLASGETANGIDRLIDRQHPHDLFMELSASVSQRIGRNGSVFLYAGLPGEPAFGPPAFMHREAIMDSPEAPITHHWLDSTHISFGVLTAGIVVGGAKVEVSRFNAREPDQHRWGIETGPLDSTAVRVSWNPTSSLALQGSWGHFVDPEQLEPGINQKRLSASALYAREIAPGWKLAGTLAWGRKRSLGHKDDAFAAEASLKHGGWTLFGRGETAENRELTDAADGPAYTVGKVSVGAVRDFPIADHLAIGAGGLVSVNWAPDALAEAYGGHHPRGAMAFLRLKLD